MTKVDETAVGCSLLIGLLLIVCAIGAWLGWGAFFLTLGLTFLLYGAYLAITRSDDL